MKKYQIGGSMQSKTSDELNPYKVKTPVAPNPSFVPSGSMDRAQQGVEKKKELPPPPEKKTGMDALRALQEYVTTFGYAKEGYNPAPSKEATKKMPEKKKGGQMKSKKC